MVAILLGLWLSTHASAMDAASVYDLKVANIDDQTIELSQFKGTVTLFVNTASQCGYTPQYNELETVYQKYKGKKFLVLGFPSNDFGGQEPGSNKEIKKFCDAKNGKYKITFPLFAKSKVKDQPQNPVFTYLTKNAPGDQGPIGWNFEKFLVNKEGQVVARFKSGVNPTDPQVTAKIEELLK